MPLTLDGTGSISGLSATGISTVQNLPATGTITNLTTTTISDGTNSTSSTNVIQGSAKAWINYNAVTQTILRSFNVSSMTYSAAGTYIMNFTTAMPNVNYVAIGAYGKFSPRANDANASIQFKDATGNSSGLSTTALQISSRTPSGNGAEDNPYLGVTVFSS